LKKKRFSDGNYYYGILPKSTYKKINNNNISSVQQLHNMFNDMYDKETEYPGSFSRHLPTNNVI
jgi:hypothetical protein